MAANRLMSLSIRDFVEDPDILVQAIGVEPTLIGWKGNPIRDGVVGIWRKHVVLFDRPMAVEESWDDAIEAMLMVVGGHSNLLKVIAAYKPRAVTFNISLPIRSSEEQEGGSITASVLSKIGELGADIAFSFV